LIGRDHSRREFDVTIHICPSVASHCSGVRRFQCVYNTLTARLQAQDDETTGRSNTAENPSKWIRRWQFG